jgi:hypothetical protein
MELHEFKLSDQYLVNFDKFTVKLDSGKEFELIEEFTGDFRYHPNFFTALESAQIKEAYNKYLNKLKETNPEYFDTKIGTNILLYETVALKNPDLSEFTYPFSFNDEFIKYKNLDGNNGDHPVLTLDPSDKIIWFLQDGERYEEAWILIFKTRDNIYCYYEASCAYSGFEYTGFIQLIYSRDADTLWSMGLTESIRNQMKLLKHGLSTKTKRA